MSRFSFFLLSLFFVHRSWAEVDAQGLIRQYDDSQTQVLSPSVEVSGTFNDDKMKLGAGWAQDVVTSASADVVTFSSKGVVEDKRTEYSAHFESLIPAGTMSTGYVQSDENDYHSAIVSGGATREFFNKNTVVGFGFSNGDDKITSSSNLAFSERMLHQVYSLSLTQLLSKVSLLQLTYEFRVENGYIASPYRRAKIIDASTGAISSLPENHPRTRNRNALSVRYNYFLESVQSSLASTYRIYQDSWGVVSHTLEERVTKELSEKWSLEASLRFYTQSQAKFYNDYYTGDPGPFFTGNSTLASYDSYMLGLKPVYAFSDQIGMYAKVEYYVQKFKNASDAGQLSTLADDKLRELSAYVIGLGLNARF